MPTYEVSAPDGKKYLVDAPLGATQDQIIQYVQSQLGQPASTVTVPPEPQSEQSGFFRQTLDVPVQVARGGVGGIRMLADVFGAGSSVSEALKSADTWLADLLSAQAKNDQRQIAQILKDAEDKGVLDQVKAGFQAFFVAPVDTLSQALGSTAPVLIAGLASGPVGPVLGTARLGAVAMPAVGAAMGVGEVKGSIYEAVEREYLNKGASPEMAKAKALEAQSYASTNLPSMAVAGGLGALAGSVGIERPLVSLLSRGAVKDVAEQQALRDAERGLISRVGLGALKEGAPEFAQASQSQLAQNIALRSEGFDVPLFRNVFGAGAMEGAAGAILGGGLAVPRTGVERLPGQQEGESDSAFARRMSREIEAARRAEQPLAPVTPPAAPTEPVVSTAPEGEDVFRFPNGSVGTLDQARAYAMNLPPEQRASTLQSILTQRVPREKTVPPDLFTQTVTQTATQPAEGAAPTKPVVAEKPTEEAKPEIVETAKPPAVAVTKEEEEVAADAVKEKPVQNFILNYPIVELPLDQLSLSKDVPQFKGDADTEGIVEKLEGTFDQRGVAPIQVWRRNDGRLEIISGRHRFDLAKRSGDKMIRAQVHDEATGFDADQASILDAELNIRDQQGKGKDYVAYFRKSGISEEDASARGLLGRSPGKPAFAIAKNGSEELVGAHRSDIVSDAGAAAIANAAPGDSRLQAVGIKAIQEGKSPLAAVNIIKAMQEVSKGRPAPEGGGDLFGFDDSAMREAEEMAKIATLKQNQLAQRLAAISGASRRPEIAKKEGIDIKDPEALKKREKELRQQRAAWDNWSSSPDLVQEIRKEMEPKPQEKTSARETEPAKEAKEVSPAIQAKIDALGKALQRIMSRYGLRDVALKLVADMKAEGEYASKVLSLALDATDPVVALRHESIHALKELGFFTPAQWKSLERQAKEKWVDQYLKQKNVNRQPLQPGQLSRYDAYMKFYGGDQEAILEEAIADAFADFSATKAPPGMLQALLKKIQNFFQAIKEAFGAEPDAERIFKKAERGELRGKEVAAPEVAEAEEAKPSLRQVPLSTRGIMESSPIYAMDELGLKTTSEKKPGGIELFNDVRSIARALNNDTINREGSIKEKDYSIASALKLARAMADEISFQVGATAKTGTGLGWYSSNYPKSVKKLAKRFPELETNPYARTVFSALVAITSNGEKVATNVKNAINLYADIREGKAVVQPGSRRATAMENNLSTLKMLMDKFGPDLRAELMREITVKDMNAALRAVGEKPDTSYLADTKVPASAIYFGPKLGAFFSNLEGAEGYLTMDLWWTRTMNRMRGLLMPKATAASINKFRDLMDRPNATREEVVSATIPLRNKYEEFGFKTELEHLVGSKEPSSKSPDLPKWNRRARALAGPAYQQLVFEHRLEKIANTIHKNEFEMLEEAPFTASDRKFMYRTAREAQGMLRDNGIDLSLADIQAALWYYEKRLYQHLSGRKADDIGYDEAIEQLAGQGSGPAGPALVFNRQPAGGPGSAGAGTEADRLGGAGQAVKFSLRDKLGLYSELESKVSQGPGKGTAEAWKGYINGLTQKGVKPEEIEWSGVRDWLDLQKGSVTKEDLLSYLKNGGVEVKEVVLRDSGDDIPFLDSAAKYSQYTLPGGENYREVLLTLPDISRGEHERARRAWVSYQEKMREKYDGSFAWRREATKEENEEGDRLVAALDKAAYGAPQDKPEYLSPHWKQRNVLAHIRVNDRTDAEGNKVLFVEEIQSDWGQQGKKRGFKGQPIFMEGMRDQPEGFLGLSGSNIPMAPFVTKTEGWLNLALKRIMVMAGEGGYDKVAFINGDQSAERNDLSKQVDSIVYEKEDDGTYSLVASRNGRELVKRNNVKESTLPDLVGRDVAERIVNGEGKAIPGGPERELTGDGLKVGGEGMKAFYDTIVPIAVKKLLPKVGGGQMGVVSVASVKGRDVEPASGSDVMDYLGIPEEDQRDYWGNLSQQERDRLMDRYRMRNAGVSPQPGFDVTPAMKERVRTTGLPRFSLRDTVNVDGTERPTTSSTNKPIYPTEEGTKNFWRWFKDSAVVDDEGRPLVVYHGTGADVAAFAEGEIGSATDAGLLGTGFYFTPNTDLASTYANQSAGFIGGNANVIPAYLSIQKPFFSGGGSAPLELMYRIAGKRPENMSSPEGRAWAEKLRNGLIERGYDGIIDSSGNARYANEIVAFNPTQIKSAIGNVGKFDPVDPSIKASLRDVIDPAIRARIDQTTTPREEKTFIKRITEAIAPKSASSFRAAFLDRYNRLSEYDKEFVRQMGGAPLLADASSHSAALMSDLSTGVLAGAMGVHDGVGGIPVYVNGHTKIVNNNNTVKGPIAIFAPLAKFGDATAYQAYQFWAGVKRGTRFDREGREQLFEKADIQKADDLRKQFLAMGVDFEAIQKDWIKFNDGLVQYLKDTGVLTEAAAKEFVKYSDYIPFYRQANGEETVGPQVFASLSGVRAPKKLKGSEAPIAEFLETVVRNVQYSIEAGMKNVAAQRAVNTAVAIGQANRLNYVSSAPNVVKVLENGRTSYYATKDLLFVEAMKSLNLGDLPFIGLLAGPANVLRNLVTKDPAFMLANMMRDSVSAWVSSGVKMTPMVDTMTNFGKALRGQNPEYSALLNSGVIGGYDYSQGVEISARRFDRALRKKMGVYTTGEKLARPFTSLWDALETGTQASDAATRMEVYKKILATTGNEAEALFRAVEVMNFNRKGNNPLVRVLTAAVPFLNARMQGLDVLYRAAFGRGTEANAKEIQKSFFIRGMTIAALSTMYWMLASEDDEWKRQEQETRDNYWILGDVKIPIPFEIGVLFKVIPERILEYSFGDDTGKDFLKSMARQLTSTLAFNPIPQTVLPIVESVTNYSFFTQRPIVSQGLESVAPAYQVGPSTSRLAELAGEASKELPTALQLSPMKVDQMIRGYTGTLGGYMVDLFDAIYDMNSDSPKATKRFEQMPVIKRFAVDPQARGQVTAYYELKNSVDEAVRTANLLERSMKPQDWADYVQENQGLFLTKDYVLDMEKSMKDFREMKIFVRASDMDADEKRDIVLDITTMENNMASNIQHIKKMIAAQ